MRENDGTEVKVNLYRELPEKEIPRDVVYVHTKQQRDVALSTLSMPSNLTPSVAARREQHSRRIIQTEKPRRKRSKGSGSSSASQLIGRQKCWVLARTSMRCVEVEEINSTRMNVDQKVIEGIFVWQDFVNVDREVECPEGKEIRRERVPASRASAFISLTNDLIPIQETLIQEAVLNASGKATEKYAKLIDLYYTLMANGGDLFNLANLAM